jgi:small-conductance mechanosensitive channel
MVLFMNDYVYSGILLACGAAAGWIFYIVVSAIFKRWSLLKNNIEAFRKPLRPLLPVICAAVTVPFTRLTDVVKAGMGHFFYILLIALFGWLAVTVVYIMRDVFLSGYNINDKNNLRARSIYTQTGMITNIINVIIIIFTISAILMTFQEVKQIGVSILASAGIVGIVVGFAAQKTLGNFIAGIQIALAQPIRLDDVVVVEGEWGRIEEITLTYVVVRIWDLRRLILPLSYFLDKPFENWTRASADLTGTVMIYADYTIPVPEIREELNRILNNNPKWDKKASGLQVTGATERTIEMQALVSAADSELLWDLRCEVREKMIGFLRSRFPDSLPHVRVDTGSKNWKNNSKKPEKTRID